MSITAETIDGYFQQYGWNYTRAPESNDWDTGFRGEVSTFRILARLANDWIFFVINPFVLAPQDPECARKLHWHLLRLNQDIILVKLALDEDDDVLLAVELPTENLDYSEFADAINALCYYADDTYLELLNLSRVPGAPSRYDREASEPA